MVNQIVIATHFVAFFAGVVVCLWKPGVGRNNLLLATGFAGVPVFAVTLFCLFDYQYQGGGGTVGEWYLVFSAFSIGLLPMVSHLSAASSGIFVFRMAGCIRWLSSNAEVRRSNRQHPQSP